jgi:hypothetical protein
MKLFEKMQKRGGVIFVIQAEDKKSGTEISEVLRPDAAGYYV